MLHLHSLPPREGPTVPTPIVPEDGISLYDPGIFYDNKFHITPPGLTQKFVDCFRKTWKRIPEKDRKTLLEFWKPRREDAHPHPFITLNIHSPHEVGYSKAQCRGGHELNFDVLWVDWSTPKELCHIIAHELGHAISYPHGWYSQHSCDVYRGLEECVACECRAFSYMAAWGFDPFLLFHLPKASTLAERLPKGQSQCDHETS